MRTENAIVEELNRVLEAPLHPALMDRAQELVEELKAVQIAGVTQRYGIPQPQQLGSLGNRKTLGYDDGLDAERAYWTLARAGEQPAIITSDPTGVWVLFGRGA